MNGVGARSRNFLVVRLPWSLNGLGGDCTRILQDLDDGCAQGLGEKGRFEVRNVSCASSLFEGQDYIGKLFRPLCSKANQSLISGSWFACPTEAHGILCEEASKRGKHRMWCMGVGLGTKYRFSFVNPQARIQPKPGMLLSVSLDTPLCKARAQREVYWGKALADGWCLSLEFEHLYSDQIPIPLANNYTMQRRYSLFSIRLVGHPTN